MTATAETAMVPVEVHTVTAPAAELTIEQIVAQTRKIQQCMELVMIDGEHYGVIPGTGGDRKDKDGKPIPPKKTLLKPGAEKLCLLFRLDPEYDVVDKVETAALIRFTIRCTLTHIPTGLRTASGLGSCNSNEDKYLRPAAKKCTACGKETVIKGNETYGGGWLCWKKKGGCGKKWSDGDQEIEGQDSGIKDPADLHNTILKMACKRALIAAVLNATAASDFFTQDLEDLTEKVEYIAPKKEEDLTKPLQSSVEQAIVKRDAKKASAAPASTATARAPAAKESVASPSSAQAGPDGSSADSAAAPESSRSSTETVAATPDDGTAATADQKDAIRLHIRKKGWKRSFVIMVAKDLFGDVMNGAVDPLERLTQLQADALHFLVLAHGTPNYRKVRAEYAATGVVRADQDEIPF